MLSEGIKVSASLLAANAGALRQEVQSVEKAGADWLHMDVMDGDFVPNFGLSVATIETLRKDTALPFDVHLMVRNPEKHVERFHKSGATMLTFHPESTSIDPQVLLYTIGTFGMYKGLAIAPGQDLLTWPSSWWEQADLALFMTVVPGFCGQPFLPEQLSLITNLKARFPHLMISVDGGINAATAPVALAAGATVLVTGSYLFSANDYSKAIKALR